MANDTYIYSVGKRKTSVATVRFYQGDPTGDITVNDMPMKEYLDKDALLEDTVTFPLRIAEKMKAGRFSVKVAGGGRQAQAMAIRYGLARVLVKAFPEVKPQLKIYSLLTCDARKVERKKPGLLKARRSPQWSKR